MLKIHNFRGKYDFPYRRFNWGIFRIEFISDIIRLKIKKIRKIIFIFSNLTGSLT